MDDGWKRAANAAMDRYAASGDGASFWELYDLLAPRISSFLLRRTRDAAQTEDLVQHTFLRMHCARRHFAPGAEVTPWAYAIARRLLIDTFRKSGREPIVEFVEEAEEGEAREASPDTSLARRQLLRRVEEELARLPGAQRETLALVKHDGLSIKEAAEVLGITGLAVRLRVHRAYEALRESLGDDVREELGELP